MEAVRHTKKAEELLNKTEDFFIKNSGKIAFSRNYPLILCDNLNNRGILYAYNSKDIKKLETIYNLWMHLDDIINLFRGNKPLNKHGWRKEKKEQGGNG